jgi:hypothetical protein
MKAPLIMSVILSNLYASRPYMCTGILPIQFVQLLTSGTATHLQFCHAIELNLSQRP